MLRPEPLLDPVKQNFGHLPANHSRERSSGRQGKVTGIYQAFTLVYLPETVS
jgi:hypothetical protein